LAQLLLILLFLRSLQYVGGKFANFEGRREKREKFGWLTPKLGTTTKGNLSVILLREEVEERKVRSVGVETISVRSGYRCALLCRRRGRRR
jgi:hypothetical protein